MNFDLVVGVYRIDWANEITTPLCAENIRFHEFVCEIQYFSDVININTEVTNISGMKSCTRTG